MAITPAIVVHGGAGTFTAERIEPGKAGCRNAAAAGLSVLAQGGSAMDAAQAAVRVLEDDPTFNAGIGAVLTRAGIVEVDASVMDGRDLRFGAIAAVPNVRQPIDLARAIMDHGDHVLYAGEQAWLMARELGFTPCEPGTLVTQRARDQLARAAAAHATGDQTPITDPESPGTVGACAIDRDGHVAAATSTGGISFKRPGRVGDTPLCGCGTYADDLGGAASATGHGESIIRVTMARICVDAMRAGKSATEACNLAVAELGGRIAGEGGIIAADASGRLGAAHNSARMAWAAARLGADPVVGIELPRDASIF